MEYNKHIGGMIFVGPRPFISSTTRSWNFLAKEKRSEEKKKSASSFTWSIVKRGQKAGTYISALYQRRRSKDYLNQISQIEIPMLMIYGTKDTVTPQLIFEILKDCLPPHTEYYVYEGDHGIVHERKDEFNQLLLDFLEKNKGSQ
jgi:pimeloyl-ACP methyl ester carboxylesterase